MSEEKKNNSEDMENKETVTDSGDSGDSFLREMDQIVILLKNAHQNNDSTFVMRVLYDLCQIRDQLKKEPTGIRKIIKRIYICENEKKRYLLKAISKIIKEEDELEENLSRVNMTPELDLFMHLLVQVFLYDQNDFQSLDELNTRAIEVMDEYNRRTLDYLQSKIWFYIGLTKERLQRQNEILSKLFLSLRTSELRHDFNTTATIYILLLRRFLNNSEISQANDLVEKVQFPENLRNNSILKYYFYLAKLKAIQLNYSAAQTYIASAIKKAPLSHCAQGFIQCITKLHIVIELLMGNVSETKMFRKFQNHLKPYFQIIKAVEKGDLVFFGKVLNFYEPDFKQDGNYTLILRLRQNVIKTGIRMISLSYSRLYLKDICIKLHLDSEELTEYIISKSIMDGVINATINHEKGYVQSNELLDVYLTNLPQKEFDQRIKFCLRLYNETVKSMRYLKTNENNGNLEEKSSLFKDDEIELLKVLEENDLDGFVD